MASENQSSAAEGEWNLKFHPGVEDNIDLFLARHKDNDKFLDRIFRDLKKVPKDSKWFRLLPENPEGYPFEAQSGQKISIEGIVDDKARIIQVTHFDSHI